MHQASAQQQPNNKGWMEDWISCALQVRQREGRQEDDVHDSDGWHEAGAAFDGARACTCGTDDYPYIHGPPGHTHARRTPSRQLEGAEDNNTCPTSAPLTRPWTASWRQYRTSPSLGRGTDGDGRRSVAPVRPHSATGANGRRPGGITSRGGVGSAWRRQGLERVEPPRPVGAPSGGTCWSCCSCGWGRPRAGRPGANDRGGRDARGSTGARGGGGQQSPSRREQRRGGRGGQVRVLAAWSYQPSKRYSRGSRRASSSPRQILVKVPCVETSRAACGDAEKKSKRRGSAPYRLAWNDRVTTAADDADTSDADARNTTRGHDDGEAVAEDRAGGCGHGGGKVANEAAKGKGDATHAADATAAAAVGLVPPAPGRNNMTAVTVQLPRPLEGNEASSTTPGGRDIGSIVGNGRGSNSLLSASDSGRLSLLEEARPTTSRVIAKLRASVAREACQSSAAAKPAPGATAAAGPACLLPLTVLEVHPGDAVIPGRRPPSSPERRAGPHDGHKRSVRTRGRPRPQSAAGLSLAARTLRRRGVQHHGTAAAGGRTRENHRGFANAAATLGPAAAAITRRGATACEADENMQGANSRRPQSAGPGENIGDRRRREVKAQDNYSFFPSASSAGENAGAECDYDEMGVRMILGGGATLPGDVSEWEASLCSSTDATSRAGYALDSPGTWREAVGF
ncbi:unnamed protein product [Ectocarpus sp. 4 AP-2014]